MWWRWFCSANPKAPRSEETMNRKAEKQRSRKAEKQNLVFKKHTLKNVYKMYINSLVKMVPLCESLSQTTCFLSRPFCIHNDLYMIFIIHNYMYQISRAGWFQGVVVFFCITATMAFLNWLCFTYDNDYPRTPLLRTAVLSPAVVSSRLVSRPPAPSLVFPHSVYL